MPDPLLVTIGAAGGAAMAYQAVSVLRALASSEKGTHAPLSRMSQIDRIQQAYVEGRIELDELEDHLAAAMGGKLPPATRDLLRAEREELGWAQAESWQMPEQHPYGARRPMHGEPYRTVKQGDKVWHTYPDGRRVPAWWLG